MISDELGLPGVTFLFVDLHRRSGSVALSLAPSIVNMFPSQLGCQAKEQCNLMVQYGQTPVDPRNGHDQYGIVSGLPIGFLVFACWRSRPEDLMQLQRLSQNDEPA